MCFEEGVGEHGVTVIIMLEQKWKSGPSKLNSFILDPLNVMEGEDREKQHRGSAIWELTNAQDGVDGFGYSDQIGGNWKCRTQDRTSTGDEGSTWEKHPGPSSDEQSSGSCCG